MSLSLESDITDQDHNSSSSSGLATLRESQSHSEFAEPAGRYDDDVPDFQQRHVGEKEGKGGDADDGYNGQSHGFHESSDLPNRLIPNSKSTSGKEHIVKADSKEHHGEKSITRRIRRKYSRTNIRTASIEYLSQKRGQFGYEDNRKIVQWMKTNRVVSFAQNREAFGKLITEFGFDNKKYAAKRELLVIKLKTRIDKMRKEMERDGKIVITKESGKIQDVQFIDSDASDGC